MVDIQAYKSYCIAESKGLIRFTPQRKRPCGDNGGRVGVISTPGTETKMTKKRQLLDLLAAPKKIDPQFALKISRAMCNQVLRKAEETPLAFW